MKNKRPSNLWESGAVIRRHVRRTVVERVVGHVGVDQSTKNLFLLMCLFADAGGSFLQEDFERWVTHLGDGVVLCSGMGAWVQVTWTPKPAQDGGAS